jgi:hypothetical protein
MKVQAVFVGAFLAAQEELAEFRGAEACADQPVIVDELVH